jgi:general secretion pathway protein G
MATKEQDKRRFSVAMILIAIIVLAYMVTRYNPAKVSYDVAKAQVDAFKNALELFKADNGLYPRGSNGLRDLVFQPSGTTNWHQIMYKIPPDPWNHPYLYECPGRHNTNGYDLSSAGPDGIPGTADDITNWQPANR